MCMLLVPYFSLKTHTCNTSTLLSQKPEYIKLRQIKPRCVDDLHYIDAASVLPYICLLQFTVLGCPSR